MTPLSSLLHARIRRIDAPAAELLALTFFTPELRAVLLVSFARAKPGVGITPTRPHGRAADSFVQKLRKELEGGRIVGFEQLGEAQLALVVTRAQIELRLICDFALGRVELRREQQALASFAWDARTAASPVRVRWPESVEELSDAGPRLLADHASETREDQRRQLERILRSAHKRLERRLEALAGDIARAEQAVALRARANSLLPLERQVKRGQTSVEVMDYTLVPPAPIQIALDPARTLKEQIEAWFKQARRFERGAEFARERALATRREAEEIEHLRTQAATADSAGLTELALRARSLGVRGLAVQTAASSSQPTRAARPRRKPYREFYGQRERAILVGKGAADNDVLTREHARPQDLWLHVRDSAGAHVVVPLERNEVCPPELLLDAAHLAAHFSGARGESQVDVSYVAKRYVRKPKGAPPGQVQLEREKVLALRLEPQRLARLLASERPD